MSHGRLLVSCLVLVNSALAYCLIERAAGGAQSLSGLVLVASFSCLTEGADISTQSRLDGLITKTGALVSADPLLLGLDVCHVETSVSCYLLDSMLI